MKEIFDKVENVAHDEHAKATRKSGIGHDRLAEATPKMRSAFVKHFLAGSGSEINIANLSPNTIITLPFIGSVVTVASARVIYQQRQWSQRVTLHLGLYLYFLLQLPQTQSW